MPSMSANRGPLSHRIQPPAAQPFHSFKSRTKSKAMDGAGTDRMLKSSCMSKWPNNMVPFSSTPLAPDTYRMNSKLAAKGAHQLLWAEHANASAQIFPGRMFAVRNTETEGAVLLAPLQAPLLEAPPCTARVCVITAA
jgi:hypothetical protein